ncbi:unnamed protein product, partial [Brachionus calyciflorus]
SPLFENDSILEKRTRLELSDEEEDVLEQEPKISKFEQNAIKIADINSNCSENLKQCAEKMLNQHIHKLGEAQIGDTVQVPIPDVDRGPGDLINILAYILDINKSNMTYRLGTKHGIISGWHSRNKFHICKQKLLCLESLDLSKESSLREINSLNSISGGQGFLKCNCSGKCERNCTCKRSNVLCNSKCHKGQNNLNC